MLAENELLRFAHARDERHHLGTNLSELCLKIQ